MKQKFKLNMIGRIGVPFKTNLLTTSDLSLQSKIKGQDISSSIIFEHHLSSKLSESELLSIKIGYLFIATLKYDKSSNDITRVGSVIAKLFESKHGAKSFFLYDMEKLMVDVQTELVASGNADDFEEDQIGIYMLEYFKKNPGKDKIDQWIKWCSEEKDAINGAIKKYLSETGSKGNIHSVTLDYQEKKKRLYVYVNFKHFDDPVKYLLNRKANEKWGRLTQKYGYGWIFFPVSNILQKLNKMMKNPEKVKKKKKLKSRTIVKSLNMKWKTFLTFESLEKTGTQQSFGGADDYAQGVMLSRMYFGMRMLLGGVESISIRNSKFSQVVFEFNSRFAIFDHIFHYGKSSTFSSASACVESLKQERKEAQELEEELKRELEKAEREKK